MVDVWRDSSPMTPRATVIVPTFDHGPLLRLAIDSVRRQSEPRLQIFIIGDGATEATRTEAESLARTADRIRFVAFPKDASRGEPYRHIVLQEAVGPIVCYLSDDDLWASDHVETMLDLLTGGRDGADIAMTLQVRVTPRGT